MKQNLHYTKKTQDIYGTRFNIKKLITIILVFTIIFTFVACNDKATSNKIDNKDNIDKTQNTDNSDKEQNTDNSANPQAETATREDWESISGNFVREDFSQFNSAILQVKYLSNDCLMFEFRLTEGDESEDNTDKLVIPSIFIVDEDGIGHYESLPDSESPLKIDFVMSKDGSSITVTHNGELDISPDGVYIFADNRLEVSEISAISILEHLPTAATSLNQNNGEYIVQYPEALVAYWFYPVQAVFKDSGAIISKFLIAKDLSAVYRADDDIEPVLIFGSAQPMMDATAIPFESDPPEDEVTGELLNYEIPIVNVEIEDGVYLMLGQESKLVVAMPWDLIYTLKAESSDSSIIEIDENGVIKTLSVGEATIFGTVSIDDGEKEFSINVTVDEQMDYDQAEEDDTSIEYDEN
jgi:hypothetical protein